MEEENKHISDLLIRYVNGLYTRNDIETLRKLASSITERAELESEMDRVWSEAQDLPQSDSQNHLLYKKEAQDLLDKTRKRERRISSGEKLLNRINTVQFTFSLSPTLYKNKLI